MTCRRSRHPLQALVATALIGSAVIAVPGCASEQRRRPAAGNEVSGTQVYAEHCAVCHGDKGDGDGPEAARLRDRPRNFVKAEYRFRTTASGRLPTDADLRRAVVVGLPGTAMVPQDHLTPAEVDAVVAFIKGLSPRFADEPAPSVLALPKQSSQPSGDNSVVLERGREVYVEAGCDGCHGDSGRGDGRNAADLSIPPTDLTRHPLKGGSTAADILRAVVTGLNGSPMPSYHLLFDDDDFWALAYWVESIGVDGGRSEEELLGYQIEKRQPPR